MVRRKQYLAIAAVLLVGCSEGTAGVSESSVAVADILLPPPTSTVPTTDATVPPTTVGLPVPSPPPDPQAIEPIVELGSIQIPKLGLSTPFFEGIALPTLDNGPGHWPGTAAPGAMGNVVIGGHRTSAGRPFRHLQKLVPGDQVIFNTETGQFTYHVLRTEIVTPDSIWIIDQTEAYTATLFACHPVGSTKERIVVFLELDV